MDSLKNFGIDVELLHKNIQDMKIGDQRELLISYIIKMLQIIMFI